MSASAELPRTMRVARMYDIDDIRIEERPLPQLEPGDVLVRTGASGVCSGDLMPWYVRRKAPFVFGHEPAGTVVDFDPGSETLTDARGNRSRRARGCSLTTTRPVSRAKSVAADGTCSARRGVRRRSIRAAWPNTFACRMRVSPIR